MICLTFQGRIKNRKRYEEFAEDVVNELLPRPFKREINIHFWFTKNVGAMGYCQMEDKDEILITIDNTYDPELVVGTIAHELVHAKQYIRGELNAEMTRWMKQEIPYGPRGGLKIKYKDQPWEMEAFEKEMWLKELLWDK